jgi:hypothetical protein
MSPVALPEPRGRGPSSAPQSAPRVRRLSGQRLKIGNVSGAPRLDVFHRLLALRRPQFRGAEDHDWDIVKIPYVFILISRLWQRADICHLVHHV